MEFACYAMKYPHHVDRLVQIGSMPPNRTTKYPPHLTNMDATLLEFFDKARELRKERQSLDPKEFCRRFWSLLRVIYVADPADAERITWDRCDLLTETNFMKYWVENIMPSIQGINPYFSPGIPVERRNVVARWL